VTDLQDQITNVQQEISKSSAVDAVLAELANAQADVTAVQVAEQPVPIAQS
jgi:hypothetical protein